MKPLTIFYSWQSDHPSKVCRAFVARALEDAAARLLARRGIVFDIDSDTQGVPGTPPVNETILKKIQACDVFLADVTFVAVTGGGKRTPNPNVMAEYGYALRDKGTSRIVLAMNTAFGPASDLPFDLHHLRHPASFAVPEGMADGARRAARTRFSEQLEKALETIADATAIAIATSPAPTQPGTRETLQDLAIATQNARITNNPPALVSRPQAVLYVVPSAALADPEFNLRRVADARHLLIPDAQARAEEGQDQGQWWAHGPGRRVGNKLNQEVEWSARLLRPGVVEHLFEMCRRIDDDRDIGLDGRGLEGQIVTRADRSLALLAALGLAGPTLLSIALYELDDVRLSGGRRLGRFRSPSLGLATAMVPAGVTASGDHLRRAFDDLWLAAGQAEGSPSYGEDGVWRGYAQTDNYQPPYLGR